MCHETLVNHHTVLLKPCCFRSSGLVFQ